MGGIGEIYCLVENEAGVLLRALKSQAIPAGCRIITEVNGHTVYDDRGGLLSKYHAYKRVKYE